MLCDALIHIGQFGRMKFDMETSINPLQAVLVHENRKKMREWGLFPMSSRYWIASECRL